MGNINLFAKIKDFMFSSMMLKFVGFLGFVMIMTTIIASQNFFFQSIIENGVSKKEIKAEKTLTVVDVKRTESRKKEVAQKVEPILTTADDDFIKNNLETLETSIFQIRKKDVDEKIKKEEISILFDIPDQTTKNFVIDFFLKTEDASLREAFDKANLTLTNILSVGLSEKDFENDNINKIIKKNLVSNVSKRQMTIIDSLLEQILVPNLVVDEFATEIARNNAENSVKPFEITFQKGDKIVFEGEPVTKLKRDALRQAGYNVYELNWQGILAMLALTTLAALIYIGYMKFFEKQFIETKYFAVSAFLAIMLAISAVIIPTGFSPYVLPIPAFAILLSIFTSPRVAFVATTVILAVFAIGIQYSPQVIVTFMLLSLVAGIMVSQIRYSRRFDLIKAGFVVSAAGLVIVLAIYILEKCLIDVSNSLILRDATYIVLNGIVSSMIVFFVLPLFEGMFNIITPYGLAELTDHELLKTLLDKAPGTYHHSLMVSNLCEAAAEVVGANPILARVGALYHDIGKLQRPLFFVENQSYFGIENPHKNHNPHVSKMLITAHTKDGVELAKKYGLPPIINNFILQHHGEGLVSYFYNEAVKEKGIENVSEEQFRYSGPKPNMKETSILMIADAVESAVRAQKNPTSEDIEHIIDKIIVDRLNDGQLSDSPLTLKDIKDVAATFNRILRGMLHERIKYQELDEKLINEKSLMPNKMLDEDLENKITQLESQNNRSLEEKQNNKMPDEDLENKITQLDSKTLKEDKNDRN